MLSDQPRFFKFYRCLDLLPVSSASFLLHFVLSSVQMGSVGSFSFFAARLEIVKLVHSHKCMLVKDERADVVHTTGKQLISHP